MTELMTWPSDDKDITADLMARYNVQRAQLLIGAMDAYPSGSAEWRRTIVSLIDAFAQAFLLRALIAHADRSVADDCAQWLHGAIDSGDMVHEMPWEWATGYGMDPEAIRAEGARLAREGKAP